METEIVMSADDKRAAIDALLSKNGVTMTAAFVPQSLSRNSGEKDRTINWRVNFVKSGSTFWLDYQQGIGHVPGYKRPRTTGDVLDFGQPWETGKYQASKYSGPHSKLPSPSAADILHCIVMDGDVLEYDFEEWASNYGYDSDSRKAESTYNECRKQSREARRVLGLTLIEEAAALLQDY